MITSKEEKKEAIRKYKEQKPAIGIYAVRCAATGRTWVGASKNLAAARNSTWFSLKLGSHHDKTLQTEWNDRGEDAFAFEILEQLKEDAPAVSVPDLLKDKRQEWMQRCDARGLL